MVDLDALTEAAKNGDLRVSALFRAEDAAAYNKRSGSTVVAVMVVRAYIDEMIRQLQQKKGLRSWIAQATLKTVRP